jgi:transposase-like protein
MIIPCFAFKTLDEYRENSGTLELEKPNHCLVCNAADSFWRHGSFKRSVIHEGSKLVVSIQRYLCSSCGKTVSLLFSFLIAYKMHSVSAVAEAIERYSKTETTYRKTAEESSSLDSEDCTPCPSHSSIFQWVKAMATRAKLLSFQIQKELVLRGRDRQVSEMPSRLCPNAWKAKSESKQECLNDLAECVQLGSLLMAAGSNVMELLHAEFLKNVETIQMIMCNRLIKLYAPQRSRHLLC